MNELKQAQDLQQHDQAMRHGHDLKNIRIRLSMYGNGQLQTLFVEILWSLREVETTNPELLASYKKHIHNAWLTIQTLGSPSAS